MTDDALMEEDASGQGGRSVLAVFEEEPGGQCDRNPLGGGKGVMNGPGISL